LWGAPPRLENTVSERMRGAPTTPENTGLVGYPICGECSRAWKTQRLNGYPGCGERPPPLKRHVWSGTRLVGSAPAPLRLENTTFEQALGMWGAPPTPEKTRLVGYPICGECSRAWKTQRLNGYPGCGERPPTLKRHVWSGTRFVGSAPAVPRLENITFEQVLGMWGAPPTPEKTRLVGYPICGECSRAWKTQRLDGYPGCGERFPPLKRHVWSGARFVGNAPAPGKSNV
jgi:hypothetical protein